MKHLVHRDAATKRVIDTVEVGETKTRIKLACSRIEREYFLLLGYSFSFAQKEGYLATFAIERVDQPNPQDGEEREQFTCEAVGDQIEDTISPVFAVDFKGCSADQLGDIVGEVLEIVESECQQNNWLFFPSANDRQVYYEE